MFEVNNFLKIGESPAEVGEIVGVCVIPLKREVIEDELAATVAKGLGGDSVAVPILFGTLIIFLW